MTQVSIPFDRYKIFYMGGLNQTKAQINCKNGDTLVGVLYFKDPADVKETTCINNVVYLQYDINRFDEILQLFQYEGPLAIHYNTDSGTALLYTGSTEPVGELEL